MDSTENTEVVSDKDDEVPKTALQLVDKDNIKLVDLEDNVIAKKCIDGGESSASLDKNVEDMLLGDTQDPGDSDNVDEDIELRWDDDDVDELNDEAALLNKASLDSPTPQTLSLKEEFSETIEVKKNFLNSELGSQTKELAPDSINNSLFIRKIEHNLNKPDMMLEIPSQEVIEFSDDEDGLTNNLEMSPDLESDEDISISMNVQIESNQGDVHALRDVEADDHTAVEPYLKAEGDMQTEEKELIDKEADETMDYKAVENETQLAADILTKELNAIDSESNIMTDIEIDIKIDEDCLLKEDTVQEDCLLKEDTMQKDRLLKEDTMQEDYLLKEDTMQGDCLLKEKNIDETNDYINKSDFIKEMNQTKESHKAEDYLDVTNTNANELEHQEDLRNIKEEIIDLCEDIVLEPRVNSTNVIDSISESNINVLKTEAVIDEDSLTNNLEMSPDLESDEDISISMNVQIESNQGDVHALRDVEADDHTAVEPYLKAEGDMQTEEKELIDKEADETMDYKALENETQLAADILTKELNAIDFESNIMTDIEIDIKIDEDCLLKDDTMQEDCLLKEDTIQGHCLLKEKNIGKTDDYINKSEFNKEMNQTNESHKTEDNLDVTNTNANELEHHEDLRNIEEEIIDLCEDIVLEPSVNSTNVIDSKSESNINVLHTETAIDVAIKMEKTLHTNETADKPTNIIEKDSTPEPHVSRAQDTECDQMDSIPEPHVSRAQDTECDQIIFQSNMSNELDTCLTDIVLSNQQLEKEEESLLNEQITDSEERNISDSHRLSPPASQAAENETHTEEEILGKEQEITNSESNDVQSTLPTYAVTKTIITPNIGQMDTTEVDTPETDIMKDVSEIKPPVTPEPESSLDLADVKLEPSTPPSVEELSMDIDEPQPSTSNACLESSKGPKEPLLMFGSSMAQDTSEDVPETTDSLGLLAESSRIVEEYEEQEYDDDGDGEDEDDFDQDESSNQMMAELSEDSNAQNLQCELQKDLETQNDIPFTFTIADVKSEVMSTESMEHEDKSQELTQDNETIYIYQDTEADSETGDQPILKTLLLEKEVTKRPRTNAENCRNYYYRKKKVLTKIERKTNAEVCRMYRARKKMLSQRQQPSLDQVLDSQITSNTPLTSGPSSLPASPAITESISSNVPRDYVTVKAEVHMEKSPVISALSPQPVATDAKVSEVVQEHQSPSKRQNLDIVKQETVLSFVDLEESSSEGEANEQLEEVNQEVNAIKADDPNDIEEEKGLDVKSDEAFDSVLQHISPSKPVTPAKLSAVAGTDKNNEGSTTPTTSNKLKSSMGLEVFNLDSDEEEKIVSEEATIEDTQGKVTSEPFKCINRLCSRESGVEYYVADQEAIYFFDAERRKRGYVCQNCADAVEKRNQELIDGVRNFTSLLELGIKRTDGDLVEISDSESEGEPEIDQDKMQIMGNDSAKVAEDRLAIMLNETWEKYKMDDRLTETQDSLQKVIEKLQKESKEINEIFNECQVATDQLRNELYATFEPDIRELPSFIIYDTPNCSYSCVEPTTAAETVTKKRARSPCKEVPAKRAAIPLGYARLNDKLNEGSKNLTLTSEKADDDNTEVSVVKLSAESAPKDLPPPGEITMTPVKAGMTVYAMKNAFGSWLKAKIVDVLPKPANSAFSLCRVKFEHKMMKNLYKILPARCLAYSEPPAVRMTIGRRVIALFKDTNKRETYYSGVVAEIPNPVNSYRYLIFFDDGYAQYAQHAQTRLVCECSCFVWEEVHPFSREFVRQYLFAYPERPMVRLHSGQNLKTEWRGKWWSSRVVRVDASLVEVQFLRRDRREWIYRGSTRLAPLYLELQAAERHRPRAVPRAQPQAKLNMPYVEYTRSDEQTTKPCGPQTQQQQQQQRQNEELRRQRAVAKKSTAAMVTQAQAQSSGDNSLDNVTSRVVYYSPKSAVKPHKMVPHECSPKCKRTDVLDLKDLRTYNPLAKPLLSGWERQVVRWKGQRCVLYVAPCGRRARCVRELHAYLRAVRSDMPVDLFDFSPATHCLAEFVLNKCFVGKKDLSHGKENVPVPCVNYYDESLPEFCSYNTERTPTAGVPLNLDPDFLCGCDCDDDCEDKTKCACWKMTLEGARTIGLEGDNVGYVYKRLPDPLPSGIYECNSRCKCKHTCLNRVAQHPLQLKLQVFKTLNRGWGIRTLNDVPKGSFLCVYAGNLLTDATANLDGLNEGDEYLAELDYIEVVEQMKEGYEEDIPESIKKLDKKELESKASGEAEDEEPSSEEEASNNKTDLDDDDFQPGHIGLGLAEFNKRLRRRNSKKQNEESNQKEDDKKEKEQDKEANPDEDCITISDDEEVREPSCFTAAAGMGANEFVSKYRSVRTLFGEDEACYIMDAKVQGNIGRYLNHSCSPNVFVQNVFVDTHDPRFPWVAFFALSHIRAGTELTWNYNYDVGSVPGKVLYCHCGASNCRGRLL